MKQQFNKKIYTIKEFYRFIEEGIRTIKYMRIGKKKGYISDAFITRIMLAVTEVNGCKVCSYYHTGNALKAGMSDIDIQQIMIGDLSNASEEEGTALLFAQHYADTRAKPEKEAWDRLIQVYGKEKALAILGAIRGIMFGNTYGIAYGMLKNRFKGEAVEGSSLFYELTILLSVVVFLSIGIVTGLIKNRRKVPLLVF